MPPSKSSQSTSNGARTPSTKPEVAKEQQPVSGLRKPLSNLNLNKSSNTQRSNKMSNMKRPTTKARIQSQQQQGQLSLDESLNKPILSAGSMMPQSTNQSYKPFDPAVVRLVFREPLSMTENMEKLWTLKRANPIADDHYASNLEDDDDDTQVSPQKRQKNSENDETLYWNDLVSENEEPINFPL